MDVDRAAGRRVEHGPREDLPERRHDAHVRAEGAQTLGPAGIAEAGRLQHREAGGLGAQLDGRRCQALTTVGGPVGLGDDSHDLMVPEHRLQRRQRELRRPVKEDSQIVETRRRPIKNGQMLGGRSAS